MSESNRTLVGQSSSSSLRGELSKESLCGYHAIPFPWIAVAIMAVSAFLYGYALWVDLSPYWFHPGWTTDDALQQLYPFYKIVDPELFKGDIITKMMECYLAPLHYWLSALVTYVVGDPIMMGHWVMLIQLTLTSLFLFLAVRAGAGSAAGFFAVAWFLHTRHVVQRLTAGLPRGWAALVFSAYLWCVLSKRLNLVLVVIGLGCLLHTPSTLVIALAHGLYLLWRVFLPATRAEYRIHLVRYLVLSPMFAILAYSVVKMPEEIGTMASYEVAMQMPEFQTPNGRFPFVPLLKMGDEIHQFAFQAFTSRFARPLFFQKRDLPFILLGITAVMLIVSVWRRRNIFPAEVVFFGIGCFLVYLLSRIFAFHLYVPNRHLQFPMAFFMIATFSIAVWRLGEVLPSFRGSLRKLIASSQPISLIALLCLGGFIYVCSGSGLQGDANFNYSRDKRGGAFEWLRKYSPKDSLIAGEPTFIDPVQLFAVRVGYVTTETAHPFYDKYYGIMKRRLDLSLRAHYAQSAEELLALMEPEGVDYFVFDNSAFKSEKLASAKYFDPFMPLIRELTSRDRSSYFWGQLPIRVDTSSFSPLVYRDRFSSVVDLRALRSSLGQ